MEPESVIENEAHKIIRDFEIQKKRDWWKRKISKNF